jgi:predicted small integral membrane protein
MAEPKQIVSAPVAHKGRRGFLPIDTNGFDRFFISVVLYVAIHLIWMRFFELYLPLEIATVGSILLAIVIIWKG